MKKWNVINYRCFHPKYRLSSQDFIPINITLKIYSFIISAQLPVLWANPEGEHMGCLCCHNPCGGILYDKTFLYGKTELLSCY